MTDEEIFTIWAPPGGRWSPWVKPVLFSVMNRFGTRQPIGLQPFDGTFAPPATENVVIILDLPGPEGVFAGLSLAHRGYMPVPLYNALPLPLEASAAWEQQTIVDVLPILSALLEATPGLNSIRREETSSPAFLLDANRRCGIREPLLGCFDNRSISMPSDFPSSTRLLSWGFHQVLLVQHAGSQPQPDLAHTLRAWQEEGLEIRLKELDSPNPAGPCIIERPSRFGAFWYRALQMLRLTRSELGGFGGMLTDGSSG